MLALMFSCTATQPILTRALLLTGAAVLAIEPARWLLQTWYAPGYDSFGVVAFALVTGLFVMSWRSPLRPLARPVSALRTTVLLSLTAGLRLAAQVLDINVIGALLLCVDVYALAHLARLGERRFAVSPHYLAGLFCFCLPVEPIVQRLLGYGLQHVSANLACGVLNLWFADLLCEGVRIRLNSVDVLVDLPCSGAELLSLSGMIFLFLATTKRPLFRSALTGGLVCLVLALAGNTLRIVLLAMGIAFADLLPVSVMDPVPHTIIGLTMVMQVTLGMLLWQRRLPPDQVSSRALPDTKPVGKGRPALRFAFALTFCAGAFAMSTIEPQPVDASQPLPHPITPGFAGGFTATPVALTEQERKYFAQFGGSAARSAYGPYGLLLVSTTSPLRHLHDPAVCLGGVGFDVRFVGTNHETSTSVYRARRGSEEYLVSVSYQAADTRLASSVAEVVWHWMHEPGQRWTMIQRIEPLSPNIDPLTTRRWQAAIRRAFNLA